MKVADNYGQVASKIQNENAYFEVKVPSSDPEPDAESRRQHEFCRVTGIRCPRQVRELFERLMAEHGFTVRELRQAWRYGAVRWDERQLKVWVKSKGVEYWLMGQGVGWLSIFLMILALFLPWIKPGPTADTVSVFFVLVFGVSLFGAVRTVVNPHRTADRIRRILLVGDREH